MLKINHIGDPKTTEIEGPNAMKERLKDAKNKKTPSVFSKLKNLFKSSK